VTAILGLAIPWSLLGGASLAVVVLVLARVDKVRWWLVSAASLGRALSPVIVPLVVIVAYASSYYAWWLELAAGAATAALLWYLWRSERRIAHDRSDATKLIQDVSAAAGRGATAVATRMRSGTAVELSRRHQKVLVTVAVLAALPALAAVVIHEGPRNVIRVGIVFFVFGALLRLVGYATSRVRWVVATLVGVLSLRVAMVIGQVPLESLFGTGGAVFWVSVAVPFALVLCALLAEAVILRGGDAPMPSARRRRTRAAGFVFSLAAAVPFVAGMLDAHRTTTTGTSGFERAYHATTPVKPVEAGGSPDLALAWTYAPMLRLHKDEVYLPASADDYATQADSVKCKQRGATPGCSRLSCPACSDAGYSRDKAKHPHGVVFYARVARGSELAAWPDDKLEDKPTIMIQYWIFYDYDRWQAKTPMGDLVQEHDADWEFVAVGLKSAAEPLFVALSAHCGGQLARWDETLAVLKGSVNEDGTVTIERPRAGLGEHARSEEATHPLVAVALGSHGNYADNSGQRPPDWGSCVHKPLQALGPLVYAANVRDETASSADDVQLKQADAIKLVGRNTSPMTVVGAWGAETVRLRFRTWPDRSGPSSPPTQRRSWHNAVRSFLCDRFWKRDKAFAAAVSAAC
jgi:hypothetical protein